MNVQVAVLCDAATDDRGKLNLLGAFDTICAPRMPAVHPQCAVALRLTFTTADEGVHRLQLQLMDADGRPIVPPLEIGFEIYLPEETHFATRNFIFNMQQVSFPAPGLYAVDIRMDGEPLVSIPLQVRKLAAGEDADPGEGPSS
ncbi:hypothetical protein G4L39_06635 [Limisphaera ngatamarikiensis]|uniref:Uncharacterized protein n=1 Tax=Limisphaera ngatamarikiensis TaxID=1324935 RepID=A0A6M1RN07_9BACT|nr:hypothetical protein [Limisphaera ngatamarikiensis]NGO39073.1 hypothetical protein [Limisphaera ngatamarikiensis]